MTYCLAIKLDSGFVVGSDSRTNAGVDYVTSYSKMRFFQPAADRVFTILSAGNLATTQEVIFRLERDMEHDAEVTLRSVSSMYEAADYIGSTSRAVQLRHREALAETGINGETTLILAGQVGTAPHEIMLIYPQGNAIAASKETPYLQIGETKYGKPVLDRMAKSTLSLGVAARLALLSLDGTANSNVSVGPPFELGLYERDSMTTPNHHSFGLDSEELTEVRQAMNRAISNVLYELVSFSMEHPDSLDTLEP